MKRLVVLMRRLEHAIASRIDGWAERRLYERHMHPHREGEHSHRVPRPTRRHSRTRALGDHAAEGVGVHWTRRMREDLDLRPGEEYFHKRLSEQLSPGDEEPCA